MSRQSSAAEEDEVSLDELKEIVKMIEDKNN